MLQTVVPLEVATQDYQDEMRSAALKKRVSIAGISIRLDEDNVSIRSAGNDGWLADAFANAIAPDRSRDDDEEKKKKRRRSFTPSFVEYVRVFSIVYALLMTIVGLLFPLSEALRNNWLKTTYNNVFVSYQMIVGIAFLVYFQINATLEKRNTRRKKKKNNNTNESLDSPTAVTSMNSRMNSCDDLSLAGSVSDPQRTSNPQKPAKFLRVDSDAEYDPPSLHRRQRRPSIMVDPDQRRPPDFDTQTSCENDEVFSSSPSSSVVWMDVSKFGSIFNHEGSSLFLKFGALMFSLGNLIYYSLEIEKSIKEDLNCKYSHVLTFTFVLRLIFVLIQTYFIFKGPEVREKKHLPILWFGMSHLISTNVCLWLRTVIREIMGEATSLDDSAPIYNRTWSSNHSTYYNSSVYNCRSSLPNDASRYLFPFVLEYSVIAVGTVACIVSSIDQPTDSEGNLVKGLQNLIKVCSLASKSKETRDSDSDEGEDTAILNKSHCGVFLGSLLFAGVIVTIVMFFLFHEDETTSTVIYLTADIALHSCLLFGCFLALVLTRPLAFVAKPMSVDDALLVIAMCGAVTYELLIIIATGATISQEAAEDSDRYLPRDPLQIASSLVSAVETLVQAMLILCAVRRYPSAEEHVKAMPGRGTLTVLIIGNVSVWVLRTALAKSVDDSTISEFYGDTAWLLLANVNLPLLLFYRFHSSVCFADVWHAAYTPLHSKLKKLKKASSVKLSRPSGEQSPTPETSNKAVPQICIIGPSDENQNNVFDAASLASSSSI